MTPVSVAMLVLGSAAIVSDLRRRRIPNWLTTGGVCAGLMIGTWASGWKGAAGSMGGALAGFAVFLVVHWLGALGAGDIKLMAAFGALLGPGPTLLAAILAAIAGALIAAAAVAWKPRARAVPYAPAIVAGAWLAFLGRT
jgi:prepilin peptidase CpaA